MANTKATSNFFNTFLNTRILYATATIVISAITGGVFISLQFSEMKNSAWYGAALQELRDTAGIINVQAYQVVYSNSEEARTAASTELRQSLILFSNQFALVAETDPDGQDIGRLEKLKAESPWLFRASKQRESRILTSLSEDIRLEFPKKLEGVWEDDKDEIEEARKANKTVGMEDEREPSNKIESLNFDLMLLASNLATYESGQNSTESQIADQIWHLTSERLLPSLDLAEEILADERFNTFSVLQLVILSFVATILAISAFNLLFVFRPMRDTVLDIQEELEGQVIKAESADKAKSAFLANMSHEIRTPINGILGAAQILELSKLDDRQRNLLKMLHGSGKSLLNIINDILDFSSVEAGKIKLDPRDADLVQIVEEAVTLLSIRRNNANTVELVTKIQPGLPLSVEVDPVRLKQVVTNLVNNALKFTHYGSVLVELTGEIVDGVLETTINVNDTGRGIPAHEMSNIFKRFARIDGEKKDLTEGTGLGLSISKHLIDLMGGDICVESELGVGSRFAVKLSLPIKNREPHRYQLPSDGTATSCLIIDESPVAGAIVAEYMANWGIKVSASQEAENHLFTIKSWQSRPSESKILVISARIIEIGGDDVSEELRKLQKSGCHIVILELPGHEGRAQLWRNMGRVDILHRPVSMQLLFDAVSGALTRMSKGGSSAQARPDLPDTKTDSKKAPKNIKQGTLPPTGLTLLVDDNEVNRVVAGEMLGILGQDYITANDGVAGLEAFKSHKPDIILMDISLPKMDGLEAASIINGLKTDPRSPIIVGMTAYAMPEDRQRCLDHGMDDYISKPISFSDIENIYKKWGAGQTKL